MPKLLRLLRMCAEQGRMQAPMALPESAGLRAKLGHGDSAAERGRVHFATCVPHLLIMEGDC